MPIVKFDSLEVIESGIVKNVRQVFDPKKMEQLLEDIAATGLTQAPSVRRKKQDPSKLEIICGNCRYRCISKLLESNRLCWHKTKKCMLPAKEVYSELYVDIRVDCDDDAMAAIVAIGENEVRVNLNEVELIQRTQMLEDVLDEYGEKVFSRKKIAEIMHQSEAWVSQSLSLGALPDIALKALADGVITRSVGLKLLKLAKTHPSKIGEVLEEAKKVVHNGLDEKIAQVQLEIQTIEKEKSEAEMKVAELKEKIDSIPIYEPEAIKYAEEDIEEAEEIVNDKAKEAKEAKERFEKLNKGKNSRQITAEVLVGVASKIGAMNKSDPLTMKKIKEIKKDVAEAINEEFYSDKVKELTIVYLTLDFVLGNVKEDEIVNILDLVESTSKEIRGDVKEE